jgi:hypothetical protein
MSTDSDQRDPLPTDEIPPVGPEAEAVEAPEGVGDQGADGPDEPAPKKKKNKLKGDLGTSRGIETMFRTSYRTHLNLSGIADNKANIMISINGIIISILLASVSPRIGELPALILPTSVFLVTCVVSMIYAILAARPRVTSLHVSLEDVRENKANLLFFGNFVNMPEEDFVVGMHELMGNTDQLYTNMVRDIYSLGGVLNKKYRHIRISYNVFMLGLSVGVALFLMVLGTRAMAP